MSSALDPAYEMWPRVSLADAETLVCLAVPYVRWLRPTLVAALAADNTAYQADWHQVLTTANITPDLYLWPGSACAYPGIRRKVGQKEVLGSVGASQSLRIDVSGNNLAHRVWELLGSTKRGFVQSRPGYELVHLFPHKAAEWKKLLYLLDKEIPAATKLLPATWRTCLEEHGIPGLFTNPANMCFLPSALVRPTDGHSLFRQVLWKQALALYGSEALMPLPVAQLVAQWLGTLPGPAGLRWSPLYHGNPDKMPTLLSDRASHLGRHQKPIPPIPLN